MRCLLQETSTVFQSHAGSIEAEEDEAGAAEAIRFQSHAGSIEAAPREAVFRSGGWGFNPTLVRLRHIEDVQDVMAVLEFQSHAGSIEAPQMVILVF